MADQPEFDPEQLRALLKRVEQKKLTEEDYELVNALLAIEIREAEAAGLEVVSFELDEPDVDTPGRGAGGKGNACVHRGVERVDRVMRFPAA